MKTIILILVALVLAGCAVGPDYKRPLVDTPSAWRVEDREARDLANTTWWGQFNDPVLNELIQSALRENYDLKIATARVEEYAGRYLVGRSGLFPQIGAVGGGGQQRVTEHGPTPLSSTTRNPSTMYEAAFTGSWEIDIWGRLRRLTEAARADLLSTEEGRRAVILTLVSAIANSYVRLRDLDKELEIAQNTARSRAESYRLFKLRFEGGIVSLVELSQVKSEYELALARIPLIQ